MIESVFAPAHPNTFEPLLNKPLTGAFNKPAANRTTRLLKSIILNVVTVLIQIVVDFGKQQFPQVRK